MLQIRRGDERGRFDHGWLDTRHTFSFGAYHDPAHMGFGDLRVINEDRVIPGAGFPPHPHRDMEIVSWVVDGALEHRDSMGHGEVLRAGEMQRMSAGRGITHSEFNHHADRPLHFLQIWIVPAERGRTPSYEQKAFPVEMRRNRLAPMVSPTGRDGSLRIGQDVEIRGAVLSPGEELVHPLAAGRRAWVQVVRGGLGVNGTPLAAGDGAGLTAEVEVRLRAEEEGEVLLFDLR
jgi:redox-sensitive bicupin YhaK (pirin superfamily)